MTGDVTFPLEALNTLQFQNNISDGGPSVYRVIKKMRVFSFYRRNVHAAIYPVYSPTNALFINLVKSLNLP